MQLLQRIVDLHGHNLLVHCLHNAAVQDIRGLRHSCVTDKNIKVLAAINLALVNNKECIFVVETLLEPLFLVYS